MDIIIKNENQKKIKKLLQKGQKNSSTRTISYDEVFQILNKLEIAFNKYSKVSKEGFKVLVNPNAQLFAKAYRYIPMATFLELIYLKGTWRISNVMRGFCNNKQLNYCLTDKMISQLVLEEQNLTL